MSPAPAPQATVRVPRALSDSWVPVMWIGGVVSSALAAIGALSSAIGKLQLDIAVYLMGARNLVDGRLYSIGLPDPPHLLFTYPPFAALVFGPLLAMPERGAQVTWALVNVVALFGLVALSVRAARPGLDGAGIVRWSLVLMAPAYWIEPVRLTFGYGQVNIVLAVLVLGDLTGHLRLGGRTLPRGVMVGIAAAVKLVPLVFIPYLFVTRQTRAAWVSVVTFVGCSAAAAVTDPRVSWDYWTKYAVDAKRIGYVFYISNQSLRGAADRLDHRVVSTGLITAASAAVVVAGVLVAAWAYRTSSSYLGVLVCAATGLLASPITWAHHMVWVVPVLIWLVWAPDRPAGGRIWAFAGTLLFWWAPIWRVPYDNNVELHEHGWQPLEGNSFFFAVVVFVVGVAAMLWVRRRQGLNRTASLVGATAHDRAGVAG